MSGPCNQGYSVPCGSYQGVNWCCSSGKICCVPMGLTDLRMLCCDPVDYQGRYRKCCRGSTSASCCSWNQTCSDGQCKYPTPPDTPSDHLALILGISIPAGVIALIIIWCLCCKKKKKQQTLLTESQSN